MAADAGSDSIHVGARMAGGKEANHDCQAVREACPMIISGNRRLQARPALGIESESHQFTGPSTA